MNIFNYELYEYHSLLAELARKKFSFLMYSLLIFSETPYWGVLFVVQKKKARPLFALNSFTTPVKKQVEPGVS